MNPTSTSPTEGATLVGREADLILNFPGTACYLPQGQMYLKKTNDGSYSHPLSGGADHLATMTIPIDVTLDANTDYYVQIEAGKFGTCDYNFANGSDPITVHFTTGICTTSGTCTCYNPPLCIGPCFSNFLGIKHLSPPDNGHFMQSYEGIGIVFNGNVTVGSGNIVIRKYSDDTAFETIDVTSNRVSGWGTSSIIIDPIGNLANDTQYYVNFDIEGYSGVADKDKWNFWTKSTPNTFSGTGL